MRTVYKNKRSGEFYEVVWSDDDGALLCNKANPISHRFWWRNSLINEHLEEYREPVVEKIIRHVYQHGKGIYTSDSSAFREPKLGKIEFTITDGKLTGVEILDV